MKELIEAALQVRELAYAPYSKYLVGAAIQGVDGRIRTGCNVENLSYGATICAERVALTKMVSEGCREFVSIAVVTKDGGTPCGLCLQVLFEFARKTDDVPVHCVGTDGGSTTYSLRELMPHAFRSDLVG